MIKRYDIVSYPPVTGDWDYYEAQEGMFVLWEDVKQIFNKEQNKVAALLREKETNDHQES